MCLNRIFCISFSLSPWLFVLSLGTNQKSLPPSSLFYQSSIRMHWEHLTRASSFAGWTVSQLLQPLLLTDAPSLWSTLHLLIRVFLREAQNWTQHSSCGLTSAEQSGRLPSLSSLAVLCLMQPRVLLAFAARALCWLPFDLVPARTLRAFSANLKF